MVDVSEHTGLVFATVKALGHIRDDEFISAGMMGLLKAAQSFKPERGIKFSSYARRLIVNEVYNWRLAKYRQKAGTSMYKTRQALVYKRYREEFGVFPEKELAQKMLGRRLSNKAHCDLCGAAILFCTGSFNDEGFQGAELS